MNAKLWIGVDVGTQSVKVTIVGDAGIVHAATSAPLVSRRADGRHEQNPAEWISQTQLAVAEALQHLDAPTRSRIGGVAICATSGTITTVNHQGTPSSTGLMYDDARAGALSDEVANADPVRWARLGYRIQPTWALPKILWLSRNNLIAGGDRIANQADVIAAAFTGTSVASDWSHSLKSGYDLLKLEWPTDVFDVLGIDSQTLPRVVSPGTVLGKSCSAWGEETGLPANIPIYAGMTDGCAAQLGAGALALGDWHSVIGTTLVVKGVSDHIVVNESGAVYSHRAPTDGLWFPGGASNVGAGALSTVLPQTDFGAETKRIQADYQTSLRSIPTSYPLVGVGERFPVIQPSAQGFVTLNGTGYSVTDVAKHVGDTALLASILLGVACVERLSVETMAKAGVPITGTFSSSGGGTKNSWWVQLRADLLGRSITIPRSAEGSIGMAILAAWANGAKSSGASTLPQTAKRMSLVGRVVEPDASRRDDLDERYAVFLSELRLREWVTS